jgi:HSF-type DNA-binding
MNAESGSKRFPARLFELLNTEAAPRSLYWLPGGKAFAIEQETFASEVLDRYFQATKFASFVRRLHKWCVSNTVNSESFKYPRHIANRTYTLAFAPPVFIHRGFRRETRGFRKEIGPELSRSVIAFCHELFQQNAPHRVSEMEEVAVAKKAHVSSETGPESMSPGPASPRKRQSTTASQHSYRPGDGNPRAQQRHRKPTPENDERPAASRVHATEPQQYGHQPLTQHFASLQSATASGRESHVSNPRQNTMPHGRASRLQTLEQHLFLQNIRNSALQIQDHDNALELLLRNQQNNESLLQRSIMTASLAQHQQELQEQELHHQHQQRAALLAAAASNQAILDVAATDRMLQLRRSASASQPSALSHQAQQIIPMLSHLDGSTRLLHPDGNTRLTQLDGSFNRLSQLEGSNRLSQPPPRDSNAQLMETLVLLELQRQQQQQQQSRQAPPRQNPPNRQFPPFG